MYNILITKYTRKKIFITSFLCAFVGIVMVGIAFADKISLNPELNALQKFFAKKEADIRMQGKLSGIQGLKEEAARLRDNKYISPEEQIKIINEKIQGQKEQLKRMDQSPVFNTEDISPFQGIFEGAQVPAPFDSKDFKVVNYWGGEINTKQVGVYAGYLSQNPSQGILVVFKSKDDIKGNYYNAPTMSGPLRIISESNGILIVESIKGEFERYGVPQERVQTSGLTTYRFDIKSGIFKK